MTSASSSTLTIDSFLQEYTPLVKELTGDKQQKEKKEGEEEEEEEDGILAHWEERGNTLKKIGECITKYKSLLPSSLSRPLHFLLHHDISVCSYSVYQAGGGREPLQGEGEQARRGLEGINIATEIYEDDIRPSLKLSVQDRLDESRSLLSLLLTDVEEPLATSIQAALALPTVNVTKNAAGTLVLSGPAWPAPSLFDLYTHLLVYRIVIRGDQIAQEIKEALAQSFINSVQKILSLVENVVNSEGKSQLHAELKRIEKEVFRVCMTSRYWRESEISIETPQKNRYGMIMILLHKTCLAALDTKKFTEMLKIKDEGAVLFARSPPDYPGAAAKYEQAMDVMDSMMKRMHDTKVNYSNSMLESFGVLNHLARLPTPTPSKTDLLAMSPFCRHRFMLVCAQLRSNAALCMMKHYDALKTQAIEGSENSKHHDLPFFFKLLQEIQRLDKAALELLRDRLRPEINNVKVLGATYENELKKDKKYLPSISWDDSVFCKRQKNDGIDSCTINSFVPWINMYVPTMDAVNTLQDKVEYRLRQTDKEGGELAKKLNAGHRRWQTIKKEEEEKNSKKNKKGGNQSTSPSASPREILSSLLQRLLSTSPSSSSLPLPLRLPDKCMHRIFSFLKLMETERARRVCKRYFLAVHSMANIVAQSGRLRIETGQDLVSLYNSTSIRYRMKGLFFRTPVNQSEESKKMLSEIVNQATLEEMTIQFTPAFNLPGAPRTIPQSIYDFYSYLILSKNLRDLTMMCIQEPSLNVTHLVRSVMNCLHCSEGAPLEKLCIKVLYKKDWYQPTPAEEQQLIKQGKEFGKIDFSPLLSFKNTINNLNFFLPLGCSTLSTAQLHVLSGLPHLNHLRVFHPMEKGSCLVVGGDMDGEEGASRPVRWTMEELRSLLDVENGPQIPALEAQFTPCDIEVR